MGVRVSDDVGGCPRDAGFRRNLVAACRSESDDVGMGWGKDWGKRSKSNRLPSSTRGCRQRFTMGLMGSPVFASPLLVSHSTHSSDPRSPGPSSTAGLPCTRDLECTLDGRGGDPHPVGECAFTDLDAYAYHFGVPFSFAFLENESLTSRAATAWSCWS